MHSFVSHNGEVDLVGSNGYDVNISQEYANSADISTNEVADHFGGFYYVWGAFGCWSGEWRECNQRKLRRMFIDFLGKTS